MTTGSKIKQFRKSLNLTQAQLGDLCGLSESAIRNYELENRKPSEKQLKEISDALNVSVSALKEYPIENSREALEILFRLEEEYGLTPEILNNQVILKLDSKHTNSRKLAQAMKAWIKMKDSSPEDYQSWKATFK